MKPANISGQRFGRLIAIEPVGRKKYPCGATLTVWRCVCDCGAETTVPLPALRTGNTRSCGCLGNENRSKHISKHTKHGHMHSRLNEVWKGMKQRCTNPKHISYKWYGKLGVSVCAERENSFEAFEKWAFANGYDPFAARNQCIFHYCYRSKPCSFPLVQILLHRTGH